MGAVVDAAVERFGKVHGVIHCAGVLGTGVLETKPREEAERVLAPKVRGTQVLEAVFRGREPELFVLTSSISSAPRVLSGFDYASANAFLDAWAHHRQGRRDEAGTHYVAIGWDTWSEVGMATQGEVPAHMKERHERSLALAVSPAEGREAFLRALDAGLTQVYVSGLDLVQRDDVRAREEALAPADESAPAAAPSAARTAHPRPELSTAYVAPEGEVQTAICGIWADLLGLEKVGVRDNLFELGGNSLIMMQLGVRLRSLYGVSLPISELFDLPEVAQLAERIESIQAVASVDIDDESSEEIEEFTL